MKFDEIAKKTKELDLRIGEYALFGSVPLAAHRIRESHDIDIIATHEVYYRLKRLGWEEEQLANGRKMLQKDCFEVGDDWNFGVYNPDPSMLIKDAEIIDGIPVVRLEEALKWKKALGREKDLKDVELIEEFMKRKD
ncbi:hypothetical protein M1567_02530 [Candidatus Marsarchaeota archaeon]|jgi:hypothetical protein|nr:hypothetical protein [Candidatus Marsarchaeota archaeon]